MGKRRAFGTVETRSPRPGFYVSFTWRGRRYRRGGGPTEKIAEQKLSAVHVLLSRGFSVEEVFAEVFGELHGSRVTFREAVPLYLEYAKLKKKPSTYASDVRRFSVLKAAPWAGNHLAHVRPEDLMRWAVERQKEGASPSTANRDLSLVSALFRWAIRMGHVDENPCRRVERFSEKGRERETYLDLKECREFIRAVAPPFRPAFVCAVSTGLRKGELLALRWRSVDFEHDVIYVEPETEKTGRGRPVPMTPDLRGELWALREGCRVRKLDGTDPVFALPDGTPLTADLLDGRLEEAVAECETIPEEKKPRVTFHTLRHTAASLMVQSGVSIFDVSKILGHSDPALTAKRYAHFAPKAARPAVDKFGEALALGASAAEGAKAEAKNG